MQKKNLPQPLFVKEGSTNKKIRVVVAISGGVDSSVAAALLKKQGYDVVGVFMRFWSEPLVTGHLSPVTSNTCCSEGAEQAARDVATELKIPFYVLNAQKEFKKAVVEYFLREEKAGRTPNPCVVCNKKIKFGLLFDKARGMGADFVATGHYARIEKIKNQKSKIKITNQNPEVFKLFKAKDENKDQSYFLHILKQKQLRRVLFPVGDYTKDEVYALAKKWKLPYRKDESFDLCFVAEGRENFLMRYLKMKEGKIARFNSCHSCESRNPGPGSRVKPGMTQNLILGTHQGLAHYTIGQRKNIPLSKGPWWVVKKDERKNILYVTNNEKDLYSEGLFAKNVDWLSGKTPKLPARVLAKIRYKSEAAEAKIIQNSKFKIQNFRILFIKPQRAITPGQSVVFYSKRGELLGGGRIDKVTSNQ